jgi:hypothetical protein
MRVNKSSPLGLLLQALDRVGHVLQVIAIARILFAAGPTGARLTVGAGVQKASGGIQIEGGRRRIGARTGTDWRVNRQALAGLPSGPP